MNNNIKRFSGFIFLKSGSDLSKICVIWLIESPLKMMKNAYFILKVVSVLKIFKFLAQLFGHAGKTA